MQVNSLERMRDGMKLNQEQVSKEIGIDRSYYSKIENGLTPSVKVAKRLAEFYGFHWSLFFESSSAINAQKSDTA
ncbi:helix-turn-helix transcriptional regulator [Geomicrobium sp. JCM 19039]|uniref:helix-turn-helix domain-containing protein n=1 Tax=Geomicrobium sp. JCM 19039 TaxID=1460636 RepID=UPI0005A95F85|nr:helix-turn-helix transcriptional regulator [Geomicrobium sp. JCM 19039]